jgi:hypothetical protein
MVPRPLNMAVKQRNQIRDSLYSPLKSVTVFMSCIWHMMPCSLVNVNRRFGEIRPLHLRSRTVSQQETSQKQAALLQSDLVGTDPPAGWISLAVPCTERPVYCIPLAIT